MVRNLSKDIHRKRSEKTARRIALAVFCMKRDTTFLTRKRDIVRHNQTSVCHIFDNNFVLQFKITL